MHRDPKEILQVLKRAQENDVDWENGRCFGYVYNPGPVALNLVEEAFSMYMNATVLDVRAFPSSKFLEDEINNFAVRILGGIPGVSGSSFSTGGTESIFLSVLAHREWARVERGITQPNIVIPDTIHPAFNKACFYLGIRPIVVAAGPDFRADWRKMEYYMDKNTIMIAGSAPSYGVGQVDPLHELGGIAVANNVGFVIDACVGGGILPFMENGPDLGFSIPGVTAITLDWHKWFMSIKGSSSVVYRDKKMLKYQTFAHSAWMGYSIVNPTITSTRSSGHMASTFAILEHFGIEGYKEATAKIMDGTMRLKMGIASTWILGLVGDPDLNLFSVRSVDPNVNIYRVAEELRKRNWFIQPQLAFGDMPPSCHMSVTLGNVDSIDAFLEDLNDILSSGNIDGKTEYDRLNDLSIHSREDEIKTSRIG